ncbi:1184_t:CDS:2 [Diversispora eburnea]|uniref:1184_t:CDS:1 n=1 Tax=Diversispora eburnea TaxID=1213867 RepID=A0A9N9F334_9GLOM|nr:1184_t:CDS:2 [Diversispora eburnea]
MKVLTKQEEDEHYQATIKGGIKGGAIGLGVTLGLAVVANRYSRFFQGLTLPVKAFLVSSAEQAGLKYEREKYGHYEAPKHHDPQRSYTKAAKDFISDNRYSILCGSWVLSMAGSIAYTSKNRYLTLSQKVVQARMIAQALTLVMVLASAGVSMTDKREAKLPAGSDQWKEMVAAEEKKMNQVS